MEIILNNFNFLRYKMQDRFLFISFVLLISLIGNFSQAEDVPSPPNTTNVDPVQEAISKLTQRQKVGQLFIFGFSGTKYAQSLKYLVENYQPGSVIIFKRNIDNAFQIAQMNQRAQKETVKKTQLPLLIMVDQEGGNVTRIKTKPSAPSALSLGRTKNAGVVEQTGRVMGHMLNILGFNMNLAPVMDLSNPQKKNFIGNRSFGNDPAEVSKLSLAFALGTAKAGVIPTGKHFPGHGGIVHDSHKELPKKLKSLAELQKHELVPFQSLSSSFPYPKAVMAAHVAFPNVDPSGVPATFSKKIITDILRGQLGFDGLVITDDVEMVGAGAVGSVGERAIQAINAGCDLVMVAWSRGKQKAAFDAVLKAVKEGRISEDRLNASLKRIIRAKLELRDELDLTPIEKADIRRKMRYYVGELKAISKRISKLNFKRAVEKISYLKDIIQPGRTVQVFSADPKFYKSLKSSVGNPLNYTYLSRKRRHLASETMVQDPKAVGIYYVTGLGTARILKRMSDDAKKRLIVVNTTHPGVIPDSDKYLAMIDLYTRNYHSARWIAEFFFKDSTANDLEMRVPSSEEQARLREIRKKLRLKYYN